MKKIYLILLCTLALQADQFSLLYYNDAFARTDQHFTNGLNISWLDDTFENKDDPELTGYSAWMFNVVDAVSFGSMDASRKHTAGIGLSQTIITPDYLKKSVPQYDDLPYVGYLSLSFFLFEWDNVSFTEYRLETGVVGEESGAKWLQTTVHRIIGATEPKGWDTQLGTDWMFNVLYRQGYKSWTYHDSSGVSMDWFNNFGLEAGNYRTAAFAGTVFRLGQNYSENFNISYPYMKEEALLLRAYGKHHGFGWSLSAGVNGELLAYSYIHEESKKEGYALDDKIFNISPYAGASVYYDEYKITFFYQGQTYTLNGENEIDFFGGFKLGFNF